MLFTNLYSYYGTMYNTPSICYSKRVDGVTMTTKGPGYVRYCLDASL